MPTQANQLLAGGSQGGFEPQRINNWILQFSGLDTIIPLDGDEFFLALKSFPFPKEGNARKLIKWWNESRAYAGSVEDFGNQTLVIRDYIDKRSAQALQEWRRKVWNPTTLSIGLISEYKVNGMLFWCPPNMGQNEGRSAARKVFIQGAWPSSFTMSEGDMDNDGDSVLVTVDISIDRAYAGDAQGIADPSLLGPQNF